MKEILYVKFSNERDEKFKIKTEIVNIDGKNYVEKSALSSLAKEHIDYIAKNYKRLKNYYSDNSSIEINKCKANDDCVRFEFIEGVNFAKEIDRLIFEEKNYEAAIDEIIKFFDAISQVKETVPFKVNEEFISVFGYANELEGYDSFTIGNIDTVFSNVIINNKGYNLIDYEWVFNFNIPIKFIKYRSILNYILENTKRGIIVDKGIFDRLGITENEIACFDNMERSFQKYVYGNSIPYNNFLKLLNTKKYNVVTLAENEEANKFKYITDIFFDYGEGVEPESVISLYDANKNNYGFVEVEIKGNPRSIRIDPVTEYCMLYNVKIKAVTDNGSFVPEFSANGYKFDETTFVFDNEDTQFYIMTTPETKKITMEYYIKDLDLEAANNLISSMESLRNNKDEIIRKKTEVIEKKERAISEKEAKIAEDKRIIDEKIQIINNQTNEINNQNFQISILNTDILNKNRQIEEIYNSTSWKITAPIRFVAGGLKKTLRNSAITKKPYEFLYYVRRFGYKTACEHFKNANNNNMAARQEVAADVVSYCDLAPLNSLNKTIAIHLHLYYVDLLDEFYSYFNNIPFKFDLFVSCKDEKDIEAIEKKFKGLKRVKKVRVEKTINRGRDIAPLYVQFGREIEKYDYFLHVHSKKSIYSGKEQYGWRQASLDCLLGSEETVRKIFALFESNESVGLFYPETFGDMPIIAQDWLTNGGQGRALLNSLGIEFDDGFFNYPVGSFFWARTDAVRPLYDRKFAYEDFPEEAGQTDGTLAHVLERAISFVAGSRGYIDAIYDMNNKKIALGKSYKVYENYFNVNLDNAKSYISQFDVITFDIFDTLITRCIYMPDDIFKLIEIKIKKQLGISCDFLSVRKKAEACVWEKKKEYTSINDIYNELKNIMNISDEDALKIKNMEIETELELCIPRKDMLEIFNHIRKLGKKIILISDMYLTSEIIESMLKKCGYEGYDQLWVSCNMGVRKDNGTMWNKFFNEYGQYNTIHIGDNPQSDIQAVIDRKRETFFVINPRTAFKMSRFYNRFKKYINGDITNSILLGMTVNAGIYNSPFCQGLDGEPVINGFDTMGYSAFGSLFSVFSLWLNKVTEKGNILMFLAREGYIFEQIYNNVFSCDSNVKRKTVYFLASRRAVSVASIKGYDEIRSILEQYYRGSFSNLMKSRLGIELYKEIEDCSISMPEDIDKVMNIIEPYMDDICDRANKERENYLSYIKSLGIDNNGVVVDVGYSGTIQYYLALLLNSKIPGAYLSTSTNKKPEKLSCRCDSLYPLNDISEEKINKIFKNQLFLEAVLKAPFGQLISFENNNGEILPVYKDDNIIEEELNKLQGGIVKFANDFGNVIGNMTDICSISSELAGEIFDVCLEGGWMSENVASIMSVQDDYCENGSHRFNVKTNTWDIVKE